MKSTSVLSTIILIAAWVTVAAAGGPIATPFESTQGIVQESSMSTALENERRLFYVALTRARKGVLIGSSSRPSRFLQEMSLQETESLLNWPGQGIPVKSINIEGMSDVVTNWAIRVPAGIFRG